MIKIKNFSLSLISFMLVLAALHYGQAFFLPLIIGIFVWYLIHALKSYYDKLFTEKLKSEKIVKYLSLPLSIITVLLLFSIVITIISENISYVLSSSQDYQSGLEQMFDRLVAKYNLAERFKTADIIKKVNIGEIIGAIIGSMTSLVKNAGMVFIYVMFMLIEERSFSKKIPLLTSNKVQEGKVRKTLSTIDEKIKKYLAIKTLISTSTSIISYIFMKSVGLNYAEFWAILIFVLNYIPTFGSILSSLFPIVISLVQFTTYLPIAIVATGLIGTQIVIGNILEPRIMGKSLNLSPLVIIISLVLWGNIWGITGMFFCVPMMAMILIILSEIKSTKKIAILLSKEGNIGSE